MLDNYLCRWEYDPPDFFDAPIEFTGHGFTVTIDTAVVEAVVDAAVFEANPKLRAELREAIEHCFRSRRWATRQNFTLLNAGWKGPVINGLRKHYAEVSLRGSGIVSSTFGAIGVFHVGADGQHSLDTKQHQIQQSLAKRLTVHGKDPTVAAMVRGLDASVPNGQDVLIRLFEVRDALTKQFGPNKSIPCALLGIEVKEWDEFGELCNEPSRAESRHLGKSIGPLKETTIGEIEKARRMAVAMLERYLDRLDGVSPVLRPLL